jgi:alkaline phosphatase D
LQFFGGVDIDGASGIMTVALKNVDDRSLWSVQIEPQPDARAERMLSQPF